MGAKPKAKCNAKTEFSVKPYPKISTRGVPDPGQIYFVKVRGGYFQDRFIDLGLLEDGTLSNFIASNTDTRPEVAISLAKTALSLASIPSFDPIDAGNSDGGTAPETRGSNERGCTGFDTSQIHDPGLLSFLQNMLDPAFEKFCEVFQSSNLDDLLGAWKARVEIKDLRTERRNLLTAERSSTTEAKLERLDAEITRLMTKNFVGSITPTPWTHTFSLNPPDLAATKKTTPSGACTTTPQKLFEFHTEYGICAPSADLEVPVGFIATSCPMSAAVNVEVTRDATDTFWSTIHNAKAKPGAANGFYYRVPARAEISVCQNSKEIGRSEALVAQFGTIVALPTSTGGRTTRYDLTLHPATGALKSFKLTSDPLVTTASVDALGAAVVARETARDAENDQLALAEREKKILEAEKAIRTLREELGLEDEDP